MHPPTSALDVAVAALAIPLLLLSLFSAASVVYLYLRLRRAPRLRGLNAFLPVRLLLILFATLWTLAELLRLPHLHHPCNAYTLSSYAFGEPCFLATLLFILRATTHPKSPSTSFAAALAGALLSALPFLALHLVFISDYNYVVSLRQIANKLGGIEIFGTVLLAALGAVYVPIFVTAGWGAVSVVINKRLRARLYVLIATVVVAISVQVAALVLSALWTKSDELSQWLSFVAFVAVITCAATAEVILVVQPFMDALAICEDEEGSGRLEGDRHTCLVHVGEEMDADGGEGAVGSVRRR